MRTGTRLPEARSAGEAGSAYIAVLLVLVVLAIFGLALSLITQTEMQVGSNERTVSRVFYAADSGIEAAVAQALVTKDFTARTYLFTDSGLQLVAGGTVQLGTQVDVSAFHPIAGDRLQPLRDQQGRRLRWQGLLQGHPRRHGHGDPLRDPERGRHRTPLAQKTVSAMIEMQPFEHQTVARASRGREVK